MDELNELENKINATNTKLQKLEARKYKIISDQIDEKNNYKLNAFVYFRNVLLKKEIKRTMLDINTIKDKLGIKWFNKMLYFTCLESVEIDKSVGLFEVFNDWKAYPNGSVENTINYEHKNIWFEPEISVDIDPEIYKMIDDNIDKLYKSKLKGHLIPVLDDYNQMPTLIQICKCLYLWREAMRTMSKQYYKDKEDIYTEKKRYDDVIIEDITSQL